MGNGGIGMENGSGTDRELKNLPDNHMHGNVYVLDAKTDYLILADL